MYEVKTVDAFEDFINAKERSDFSDYSTKSKYWDNLNKLVVGIMKDERAGTAIEELFGLKSKLYSYLGNDNNEYEKAKDVNRNAVATISNNEYKKVLLKKKCLRD